MLTTLQLVTDPGTQTRVSGNRSAMDGEMELRQPEQEFFFHFLTQIFGIFEDFFKVEPKKSLVQLALKIHFQLIPPGNSNPNSIRH